MGKHSFCQTAKISAAFIVIFLPFYKYYVVVALVHNNIDKITIIYIVYLLGC